jgi:hypothetical protein
MLRDTYEAVDCLCSLPRLTSLNINLNEEEQVDYIMKHMPDLQILNDLEVERDEEEESEQEEEQEEEREEEPHREEVKQPKVQEVPDTQEEEVQELNSFE